MERRSLPEFTFNCDKALMIFHNALAECQPDSRSCEFAGVVQALEHRKNLFIIFLLEANAVVGK